MRRREFISLLGGAAAWPLMARAQQPVMPVIGLLSSGGSSDLDAHSTGAFRRGLGEVGYIEGRNVAVEHRSDEGQYDRLPALAAELVRRQVTVIVTAGTPAAVAAKAATTTIPIVFSMSVDPVEVGLVASLNRPGGNITGVVTLNVEVGPKRLELLHELVPTATVIGLLVNPTNSTNAETVSRDLQAAAHSLGVGLPILHASAEREFDSVFANLVQLRASGLVIITFPLTLLGRADEVIE
jgi:putative ABC transport system substrate-binding protein